MISKKAKEEVGLESSMDEGDEELMTKIKNNIERLAQIMEGDTDLEEEIPVDNTGNKILH